MLTNDLKIAWRHLLRNKTYAVINVVGLALGIACCVLLALFVRSEWTYDAFHEKADRIVRVNRVTTEPSGDRTTAASSPAPLAPALTEAFPEVETAVRLNDGSVRITQGDTDFEAEALFADSTFFDVFSFTLLRGTPERALRVPQGIVLTEPAARRYFGTADPLGETLTVRIENETIQAEVTGVVEAPPARSSLQFEMLLPFPLYAYNYSGRIREVAMQRWDFPVGATFALLRMPDQRAALASKLDRFADQHFGASSPNTQDDGSVVIGSGRGNTELSLQPLTDIHLNPDISPTALTAPSDPIYSYLLAGAALLVLLIGGINFTTLALGRSAGRAREVGVRKVLGARRGQVRSQFWGEALLTSSAALILGLVLASLFLPAFNQMAGTELTFALTPSVGLGLLGLTVLVGLLAGSYPALVLSRFAPAPILRGSAQIGGQSGLVRGLVVLQFTLSAALVAGTLVMSEQLDFMQSNLGFRTEQVMRITELGSTTQGKALYTAFRTEARRHPGVQEMGATSFSFFFGGGMDVPVALGDTAQVTTTVIPADTSFLSTMDIAVVDGRGFDPNRTDRQSVVVNRAFVQAMGWTSPVGKTINLAEGSMLGRALGTVEVIGVTENFHTQSMRTRIQPVMIASNAVFGGGVGAIYVRIAPDRAGETIDALREAWTAVAPDRVFHYSFFDDVVDEAYQTEQRLRSIVQSAAGFALFIACFGLFGLAALAVARRTREVGIRKALGASVTSIIALFSKDFLTLTGVAVVLALPLAYWGAQQWLQTFAYRVDLGPGLFLLAGGLILTIALLTVSAQAWRAARIDPATTLRDE